MTGRLVSPNEMHEAAISYMLGGRKPKSNKDWEMCVNFWASNMAEGLEIEACVLMGLIFKCPLSRGEIEDIVIFQQGIKAGQKSRRRMNARKSNA